MKPPLRIALIVGTVCWYDRELIDGIAAYSREHGPWRLVLQADTTRHRVEPWVRQWKPDGVLARITGPRMAKEMRGLGIPVVDLLEESGSSGIPRIVCDDRAVVQRAVDHLLDRHLRHFAYVGRSDVYFSVQRQACFHDYLRDRQQTLKADDDTSLTFNSILLPWKSMPHLHVELAAWLRALPKPVGVVACNDVWGAQVLRVCNEFDFHVPDDIAVIGIDDDPVICQMCTPTLSSIGANARAIGYRAAGMLHGMIVRGESPPPVTFVEPGSVQPRASTATLAVADADVVAAMWFLREHACRPITIPQVAKTLGVSRRTLERAFMRHVGHSPAAEITRARLERAKELLIGTDLSLPVVARQTGFFRAETLHRAFKKHAGITPGEYRRAHRAHSQRSPRPLRQTRSR